GTVKHAVEAGVTMKPGDVIGHIYAPGEAIPSTGSSAPAASTATADATVTASAPRSVEMPSVAAGGRVLASPAARRLAGEMNVHVGAVWGSGPLGRIVEADVRAAANAPRAIPNAPSVRPAATVPTGTVSASASPSSPVARRTAAELGVDLARVQG